MYHNKSFMTHQKEFSMLAIICALLLVPSAFAITDIKDCQTITQPGTYNLANSISSLNTHCILIQSDNVIFDGQGHTLAGANQNIIVHGIFIDHSNNVQVKNISIQGYYDGVVVQAGSGAILSNLNIHHNLNTGILVLFGAQNTMIQDNQISNNGINGIAITDHSNNAVIARNTIATH